MGKSASVDGTKWDIYENNLLAKYHIHYGGYGGLGYYHVADNYIALFSHFIPCGVFEALYLFDGLLNNHSDIQPDTLHGDTHSQSLAVFGLAYLLFDGCSPVTATLLAYDWVLQESGPYPFVDLSVHEGLLI